MANFLHEIVQHVKDGLFPSKKSSSNELPINAYKDFLVQSILENQVIIVHGETGCGKTTQMPKIIYELELNGDKVIGVTQPRRLGAINMAKRVAFETRCALGKEIGYEIRFDNKSGASTKIKYMTDAILLNKCITDRNLSEFSHIIVDEAHERSLQSDVLLGLLKDIVSHNEDLKIIITSATMDSIKFSKYFFDAPIINIEGRSFNVDIIYYPIDFIDYIESSVIHVLQISKNPEKGDILIFLTCQEEIETCVEALSGIENLILLPLYGAMEYHEQQKIFDPVKDNERKVIISTNLAETSLTIDSVRFVIDCGYVRQKNFNPKSGIDNLEDVRISKSEADQRKGRVGRTINGWCYRLYGEIDYDQFSDQIKPEILRKNLSEVYMKVLYFGLNPKKFNFIDSPTTEALLQTENELKELGFLDDLGNLTTDGQWLGNFPVEPRIGKVLLASIANDCVGDMVTILALLTEKNIFRRPKSEAHKADKIKANFFDEDGDPFVLLVVYKTWILYEKSSDWCRSNFINHKALEQIHLVHQQLISILKRQDSYKEPNSTTNKDAIKRSILAGYFKNICRKRNRGEYSRCIDKLPLYIHPGSSLFKDSPEYVLYSEVRKTKKPYMLGVLRIDESFMRNNDLYTSILFT